MSKADVYTREYWASRNSFMEAFVDAKEKAEIFGQDSSNDDSFFLLWKAMKLLDFEFSKLTMARGNMKAEGVSFHHLVGSGE